MTPAPITQDERVDSLDALRGFALLGILPANILIFGMYFAAANNPTVAGGATGLNLAAWALFRILIEGKMRGLFSIAFGASAILLSSRLEARSPANAADIYYRRVVWLLLFGMAHGFLLFWGDILYQYALCGLILFPFRKLPARQLLIAGVLLIAFKGGWTALDAFRQVERRNLAAAGQAEAQKELEAQRKVRKPSAEELEKDARQWRGNPVEVVVARAKSVAPWQALPYYDPSNSDILSMMFIGMGLFKLGVLSAARSYRFYVWTAAAGFLTGIPLNAYICWLIVQSGYDRLTFAFTNIAYDIERLPVALAYVAVLMILCKAGVLCRLTGRLEAIGRMALSNYIFQSVVCAFVFTGYGFGL